MPETGCSNLGLILNAFSIPQWREGKISHNLDIDA